VRVRRCSGTPLSSIRPLGRPSTLCT
jgi:hypothetical protein